MKRNVLRRILHVVLFIVIMYLLIELPNAAKRFIAEPDIGLMVASLLSLLVYPLMYAAVIIFLRWEGNTSIAELGGDIHEHTVLDLIIGLVAGIAGSGMVVFLALVFDGQLRPIAEITPGLVLGNAIVTVLVSYVEELAYRGYLLTRSSKLVLGKPFGIILSSIVFSLLHYSWWVPLGVVPLHLILLFSFNLFLGGIVLSLMYFLSGRKLWAPIGFHFAWNIIAYVAFPVFPTEPVENPALFQIEWGITTIPAFLVGLAVAWLLLNFKQKKDETGGINPPLD
ncbi:MAG: CPBP family intramembrane metalloprotease [Candidatus Lokiarchaeota archaeon]|nr:CPBP family intramembrane metalloprotease [Candidatus Lokiarchaeota archaeon]